MILKTLSIIFISAVISGDNQHDPDAHQQKNDGYVNDFISSSQELIQKSDIPGVALAVVRGDGEVWTYGFGYADLEKQLPMTDKTIISIGSVSKTITGVAVMQTVEKGLLGLDTDINKYLNFPVINPQKAGGTITAKHILTHTSGIIDHEEVYGSSVVYYPGGDNPLELGSFLKEYLTPKGKYYSSSANFTATAPGDRYQYSNVAYGLAGHLVEGVTAQPFYEYTKENLFTPLGMNSTGWKYSEINEDLLGKQYGHKDSAPEKLLTGDPTGAWRAYKRYSLATYPDGGLRTSVSDLSHFLIAMINKGAYKGHRILEEDTFDTMMTTPHFGHKTIPNMRNGIIEQALSFAYEVPLTIKTLWKHIGHSGADPGTNTYMYYDPETKYGIIYFTNSDEVTAQQYSATQTIIQNMILNADKFFIE